MKRRLLRILNHIITKIIITLAGLAVAGIAYVMFAFSNLWGVGIEYSYLISIAVALGSSVMIWFTRDSTKLMIWYSLVLITPLLIYLANLIEKT